jgi:enterochelin esterase-like enzyme
MKINSQKDWQNKNHFSYLKSINPMLKGIIMMLLMTSCQANTVSKNQTIHSEKVEISYTGNVDVVEFKMFEGLSQVLHKDSSSGTFVAELEIPNLSQAIFTYDILTYKKDSSGQMKEVEPVSDLIKLNHHKAIQSGQQFLWIGEKRNVNYTKSEKLTGSLSTKSVFSKYLNEERNMTIYTPAEADSNTPVFYLTDGTVVGYYAPYVDHLISINKIKPVHLIGVHASEMNRHKEYVRLSSENSLFEKHQNFFYNEIIAQIEKEIKNFAGKRYLFGFSNGAAFCMHAGLTHPQKFEEVVAFSTADYISSLSQWMNPTKFEYDKYPNFYMGAGTYEKSIYEDNIKFIARMKENGITVNFKEFVSGHDYNVWRIEFLQYLENRFKKQ